jgi:hypothetical protein
MATLSASNLSTATVSAQYFEQDDCSSGYIVNEDETGCIRADNFNDPNGCSASGGSSDEIERCVASTRSDSSNCKQSFLGLPTWYEYLEVDSECSIVGPTQGPDTDEINWAKAAALIGIAVVEILLRVATLAAIGFVMYGGFRYMTSQGEPESTKNARQTIQNAIIGLVLALLATAIVSFVGNRLG